MPRALLFLLGTFLLSTGLLAALAVPYLPASAGLIGVLAILSLAFGTGLLLKKLPLRYLLLAVLLAVWPALAIRQQLWPGGSRPSAEPVAAAQNRLVAVDVLVPPGMAEHLRGRQLQVPPGWEVAVFASGLGKVRMLALNGDGVLLASLPGEGKVVALPDADRNGRADRTIDFAEGLNSPHGLGYSGDLLWVAGTGVIYRLPDRNRDLRADRIERFSTDIPGSGGHWTRSLAVAADGSLLVSAGSSCNACRETDQRRASVMRFVPPDPAGSLFASGLRNSVGLAFRPGSDELWGSDNGRDLLGDDLPPDEINLIRPGGDYGWPDCYGQRLPDPQFGSETRCRETLPSAVDLQAHSAPLGIAFMPNPGLVAGADQLLLVAFHGSWNRSVPTGYKLVAIPFQAGRPVAAPVDLVRGWLGDGVVWGRPVAPLLATDGAILLSDDYAGVIYRITPPRPGH